MAYAEGTQVPVEKTKMEIEGLLKKHNATSIITGWQGDNAVVMFEMKNRRIRFNLTVPPLETFKYNRSRQRTKLEQENARAQVEREKWRLLLILIKGKLESVAQGVTLFEQEFLPNVVLPSNETVGEWLNPQLETVYNTGKMPPMLPGVPIALPAPK